MRVGGARAVVLGLRQRRDTRRAVGMTGRGTRCIGCMQSEHEASGKFQNLQCGHVYCELCLTAVKGCHQSMCPACGVLRHASENTLLYPVTTWLRDQQERQTPRKTFEVMAANSDMTNTEHGMAGNSQKHLLNCDEIYCFPVCSAKMNVHEFISNSPKKVKRFAHSEEVENLNIELVNSQTPEDVQKLYSASFKDEEMLQLIEDALASGSINVAKLKAFMETLDHLNLKKKQDVNQIEQFMKEEFTKMYLALQARSMTLHRELIAEADGYYADIENVKKNMKVKLENLKGATQVARGLKETPSSKAYCDLNQIVSCLKSPVEGYCSVIEDLKSRTCSRIHIDSEEILCSLMALGKLDFEPKRSCQSLESGDTGQAISYQNSLIASSSCDTYLSLNDAFVSSMQHLENESPIPPDSFAVCAQLKNMKPKEGALSLHQKSLATLPQASSSPDVIIEEIIDENDEVFLSESISEMPKKLKKSVNTLRNSVLLEKRANDQELVFVTHVVNPCHFYIQRYSKKKTANQLEQNLALYCSTNCAPCLNDVLVLGEHIFVRSNEHCKWCHAIITELVPLESKNVGKPCGPTKYEVKDISVMKVFLQDFGSSEVLIINGVNRLSVMNPELLNAQFSVVQDLVPHIRKIDSPMEAKLRSISPLAVQCALKDIVPHDSERGWGEEVKEEFLRMVNNKAVLMKVFKEEDGKLTVDLKKPKTNKMTSDMPVSLRDALVFTELARFRSELPRTPSEDENVLRYSTPLLPQPLAEITVAVSYVKNPFDFYVQMVDTLEYLNVVKNIQEVYASEDGDNLEILCPLKGQACIAMYDHEWYRAEVISLPGHREVEVKYIDFGNIAKVNVKNLRKVKDEFLNIPQKGIWCQLAHIEPLMQSPNWNTEVVEEFEKLVCEKPMQCTVISVLEGNKLSVELYDPNPLPGKSTTSVNRLLVEANLATLVTGELPSENVHEIWDPAPEPMLFESTFQNVLLEDDLNLVLPKSREEFPVRVKHVESPSKLFVQWLSSEDRLKRLQDEMYEAYFTSKAEKVEWCVDMCCATEMPIMKEWRRGRVKHVTSETHVKVSYFDYGMDEIVNVSRLRLLREDLNKMGPLSLEISLRDIRPAGGSDKWTATACDFLSLHLTGIIANLILEDDYSKSPLPAKMFFKDETGQIVEVSDYLVKKGLALRDRRIEPGAEAHKSPLDVVLESETSLSNEALPQAKCDPCPCAPDDLSIADISCIIEHSVVPSKGIDAPYNPPGIPNTKTFEAEVSSVGDDGTIYVVQKSSQFQLEKLMEDMQNDLKFLGILEPYGWKKGEGCSIRGSDTMWYRGKVMEVVGGSVRVYYVDSGCIEKIPECHLFPSVSYPEVSQLAIPCKLHNVLPVGNSWQPDAVELLKEFLMRRHVDIHPVGSLEGPEGQISVNLHCDGISLSHFMEQHKHCFAQESQHIKTVDALDYNEEDLFTHWENNFEVLLLPEFETPLLPRYALPQLPCPGLRFPVTVKHVETPNEMFISIDSKDCATHLSDTDDSGLSCNSDMDALESELRTCNQNIETLLPLNDFRSEMPCLATYTDGQVYRSKLISIKQYDPVTILVEHVDYGSSATLTTDRIFQIPCNLVQYPTRALKVKLAGFKPPLDDGETERLSYSPAWSMEALWTIIDGVDGKQLSASIVTRSPEPSVFLYEDERYLVHMPLIDKGLADLD
ncbi:RING finger protein 17 [Ambystoma mexicanum]|uniref:RING finger protein 17 n=1 Tax=Ambystoma mexicanum TaxID=8296 RepID=UPI0037E75CEB